MTNLRTNLYRTIIMAMGCCALAANLHAQSADALIHKLVEKGVLSDQEAKDLLAEAQTNKAPASKWKINDAIKDITLFGDVRLRYEYRSAENLPGKTPATGVSGPSYARERFRYAVRLGIRGDLFDSFYYGLRVETSSNPRSPWNTFGDDTASTPSAKNSDGINIGQAYLGWRPTSWYEMTVGKFPMPIYTTPMIWDSDINPEGAVEKFKVPVGNYVDLFANFGQFMYQDTNPDPAIPSSDTFLLAWQLGGSVKLTKDMTFKVAPVLYNYTGVGASGGLNQTYTGEGLGGTNVTGTPFNQNGINDLLVLEIPAEINLKLGNYNLRTFGDYSYNLDGKRRAENAFKTFTAAGGALPHAFTDEIHAYQVGLGIGNYGPVYGPTSGLVYGSTSKKNTWEARAYWQHVEQYAADVNLLDSDYFEGRGNLQGVFSAIAYSITDNVIGTFRYGYAQRINDKLGTGGNNPDLPLLNPIRNYHLLQFDLTLRF